MDTLIIDILWFTNFCDDFIESHFWSLFSWYLIYIFEISSDKLIKYWKKNLKHNIKNYIQSENKQNYIILMSYNQNSFDKYSHKNLTDLYARD
jgi:hypothetical protein